MLLLPYWCPLEISHLVSLEKNIGLFPTDTLIDVVKMHCFVQVYCTPQGPSLFVYVAVK
jgi:hypothetical protein